MSARVPGQAGGITLHDWIAADRLFLSYLATDVTNVPVHLRIMFAGMHRMNAIGHAEFGDGELAEVVGTSSTAGSFRKAIRTLKEMKILMEESSARCLVFAPRLVDRGKGSRSCRTHRLGEHADKPKRIRKDRKVQGKPIVRPDESGPVEVGGVTSETGSRIFKAVPADAPEPSIHDWVRLLDLAAALKDSPIARAIEKVVADIEPWAAAEREVSRRDWP
ncbi:hypothetical protein ACFFX1_08190 [Dactylosporangium sucinum]|uniref:Uncharacterized protein n=1 Tax=Dactylosporangium sucinum TaxID=1424081 RepID=A0A917X2M8_9ACTN|nr:hypothetical protein [Dactylosporangium sucinum]GGM55515.1 hypothetical protein GCM10007977_066500 [Dactylosporangium sucinum]